MRVAVVCPYDLARPGGVQQLTIELVERLGALGHEAWLVGPGMRPGATSVGTTVRLRANDSVVPIALGPGVARAVRAAVADADVIHVHEPFIPRVGTAASAPGRPRVLTFHADAPGWVRKVYSRMGRPERVRSAVTTAVSPVAAAALPESWGPIEVIPNAIETARYRLDVPRLPTRVTFLGRDEPRKGLDLVLAAWETVRRRVPEAELVVMGAGRDPLPGVRFLGRVDEEEKRRMLASATVHVAPNTGGESFGIVLAEAMAAGAAVVASDLAAFRAVVGDAGELVEVGAVAPLAEALVRLLADPAETARLGEAGRERANRFDWSVVIDRYLAAYDRARA